MRLWSLGRRPPDLDWVQVEVTTRCNAECAYCPRRSWADRWFHGDLEVELFRRLLRQLRQGTLVYLQGWGEPLLHPDLPEMVAEAKAAGHPVATTTNGLLLDEDLGARLADAGLDILGLSLVRADAANDCIRAGTSVTRVLRAVEAMAGLRERRGGEGPRVHVAYLLLRSQVEHLPEAVRTLGEAGADQVVVSSLDLVPDEDLLGETLWGLEEDDRLRLLEIILAAEEAAEAAGTELVAQLAVGGPGAACPENRGRSVYVGFDGAVLPCVMAAVPVRGRVTHRGPGGPAVHERRPLANLREDTLLEAWRRPAFEAFRRGVLGRGPLPRRCEDCFKREVRRVRGQPRGVVPELIPFADL